MNDFNKHNYLCHHGIKGMKWGVRRYQNVDGSLTSAGKERYGSGSSKKGNLSWPDKRVGMNETKRNILDSQPVTGKNYHRSMSDVGSPGVWGPSEYVTGSEPNPGIKLAKNALEETKALLENKYKSKVARLMNDIERYYKAMMDAPNDSATLVNGTKMNAALDELNKTINSARYENQGNLDTMRENNIEFDPVDYVASLSYFKPNTVAAKYIFYKDGQFIDSMGSRGTVGTAKQRIKMPKDAKHTFNFNEHNYLCHYGIKGMKWGIRRYQDPNGVIDAYQRKKYVK